MVSIIMQWGEFSENYCVVAYVCGALLICMYVCSGDVKGSVQYVVLRGYVKSSILVHKSIFVFLCIMLNFVPLLVLD